MRSMGEKLKLSYYIKYCVNNTMWCLIEGRMNDAEWLPHQLVGRKAMILDNVAHLNIEWVEMSSKYIQVTETICGLYQTSCLSG